MLEVLEVLGSARSIRGTRGIIEVLQLLEVLDLSTSISNDADFEEVSKMVKAMNKMECVVEGLSPAGGSKADLCTKGSCSSGHQDQ